MDPNNNPTPSADQEDPSTSSSSFAFRVIRPNERKRQQLLQVAQEEANAYERHRQSRQPQRIQEPPRRLTEENDGAVCSLAEARRRQQWELATAKIRSANQAREAREKAKEEENAQWQAKKEKARLKGEQNQMAEKRRESRRVSEVRDGRSSLLSQVSAAAPAAPLAFAWTGEDDDGHEDATTFSAARAAEKSRAVRAKAHEEEEELLKKKKAEARRQAEKNEAKKAEVEKQEAETMRASRDEYFRRMFGESSADGLEQNDQPQSLTGNVEDHVERVESAEFSAKRDAEKARAIRDRAREEEEEEIKRRKEEARLQAERNEEKRKEREKVDVVDLRAKRLQALGL